MIKERLVNLLVPKVGPAEERVLGGGMRREAEKPLEIANRWQNRFAGRTSCDSTALVREDRDTDMADFPYDEGIAGMLRDERSRCIELVAQITEQLLQSEQEPEKLEAYRHNLTKFENRIKYLNRLLGDKQPKNHTKEPPTMALTKAALVELINYKLEYTKSVSADLVETVIDIIKKTLESGENVKVAGFGNFQVKQKADRKGRNPQTGEAITIAARQIVTFKPSIILKNKLNK